MDLRSGELKYSNNVKEILKVTNKDELGDYKTFTTGDYCRKNNIFWPKG